MRALYMMSCVLSLAVAIPVAATSINPHQVTNFDRTTCDSLPGTQVWSEEIGACVCSPDSNPFFEPRAAKGEGRCLPETVWSEYQEVFGPTEPIELTSSNRPVSSDHPQPPHADTDNDGYSDEWDTNDNDPSVSPAVLVSVTRASEPTPPPAPAVEPTLEPEPVIHDSAPESAPSAEETVESDTSDEDAVVAAEREAEENRRETEAADLARAKAEREAREAERQAELERREREATAEREAERRRAEETNIVAEREQELELSDDDDYFADDDDDDTFDPEQGLTLVTSDEAAASPDLAEVINYDHGFSTANTDGPSAGIDTDEDSDGIKDLDDICPDVPAPGTTDGCPPRAKSIAPRDDDADARVDDSIPDASKPRTRKREHTPEPASALDEILPDLDEGPIETAADRKTEHDERRAEHRLEREAEQERKRQEREAEQARKERERKVDQWANRLAAMEWNKGHLAFNRYPGNAEIDTDSDGLPDDMDLCPNDPEDFDDFVDSSGDFRPLDGCPDESHGFIRLRWDSENKRFDDMQPTFIGRWDELDNSFWFKADGSYTATALELLRELALVLEAYDLKIQIGGRAVSGADQIEKVENMGLVGRWAKALAAELMSQCVEAGYADCETRVSSNSMTGYSGLTHNCVSLTILTH